MAHFEKTVSSEEIFNGRILRLCHDKVLLENGETAMREVAYHPGGVCVLPILENRDILLVRQFRYPYREETLELPAGKLNPGEDPLESGRRELKEETGASAREFISMGVLYPSPGYCSEILHMYLARGIDFGKQCLDEDEFLDVVRLPLEKAVQMVMDGQLPDGKTQALVLRAKLFLNL